MAFCLGLLLGVGGVNAWSQPITRSIGLRGGTPLGLTYKQYLSSENAWSVTVGRYGYGYWDRGRWRGDRLDAVVIMGHYLWQNELPNARDLYIYYGPGGKMIIRQFRDSNDLRVRSTVAMGLNGLVGLEYFIPQTPISVFLDIGPYLEIIPAFFWIGFDAGGGVRINF